VRIHILEERRLVVRGGVEFRWVVISVLIEDDYISVELKLGIGGVGGALIGAVIRGSWRQIWRGSGEVVVEVIVEMRGGEGWRTETLILVIYIIMAVHGEGGIVASCNLCDESDPFGRLCMGDRDEDWR